MSRSPNSSQRLSAYVSKSRSVTSRCVLCALSFDSSQVSSIAWKLSGLNDIIEIVTKPPSWLFAKDDTNNPASRKLLRQCVLSTKIPLTLCRESARFLVKDQVLQYLFKEGAHPELLRRLGPLLRFLASKNELTLEFFDELWQCSLVRLRSFC